MYGKLSFRTFEPEYLLLTQMYGFDVFVMVLLSLWPSFRRADSVPRRRAKMWILGVSGNLLARLITFTHNATTHINGKAVNRSFHWSRSKTRECNGWFVIPSRRFRSFFFLAPFAKTWKNQIQKYTDLKLNFCWIHRYKFHCHQL